MYLARAAFDTFMDGPGRQDYEEPFLVERWKNSSESNKALWIAIGRAVAKELGAT